MKKIVLFTLLSLMFVLAACGNGGNEKAADSDQKSSGKTVKIKNDFEASGENKDGSDAKKVSNSVEVPVNPKNAVVLDYGALDVLKVLGVADKVKGLPKGEDNKSLPDFLAHYKDDQFINTGNLKEVNFDKIAEAKPEVIFISGRTASQKNLDEFKKAAPKAKIVYVGTDDKNLLDSMEQNTENLGKIFDKEEKAKGLNKALEGKLKDLEAKTKGMKDKAMYLLVNEGELSTFGPGERFGSLIFDTFGFTPVDDKIKDSTHGQNVTNEYISEMNPDIIFAMDRGQAIGGKSTAKKVLSNDVLKNVSAIKKDNVYELDPKLWYLASGSTTTTMKQIEDIKDAVK